MRLIDADSLWMTIIHTMDYCEDILEFIEEEPEAVVRCKDCRKRNAILYCERSHLAVKDVDYCSKGERREDAKTN